MNRDRLCISCLGSYLRKTAFTQKMETAKIRARVARIIATQTP